MRPKMSYKGFTPNDDVIYILSDVFDKLAEASPYESYIEASITKNETIYLMEILINHAGGKFFNSARGTRINDLIFRTADPVFAQIKHWAKNRNFDEVTRSEGPRSFSLSTMDWRDENLEKNVNVLIVDDDVESVVPLKQCLQKLGCSTNIVTSGFDAIHELLSGDRDYDVIFLDWQMPEMSGVQALQNAQKVIAHAPSVKEHWSQYQLPVILFSSCQPHEVQMPECRDFKVIDHWEKSIPYRNLLQKVSDTFLELKKAPLMT